MQRFLFAIVMLLVLAAPALADQQTAQWWAEEQKCLADCPKMPRFGGTETNEQYLERMRMTDAYNACQRRCTEEYLNKVDPKKNPYDDGSEGYFKRNQ